MNSAQFKVKCPSPLQGVIVKPMEANVSANPLPHGPVHDVFHRKQCQEICLGKPFCNNEGERADHDHDIGRNILSGHYNIPGETFMTFQLGGDGMKIDQVASPGQQSVVSSILPLTSACDCTFMLKVNAF